MPVTEVRSAMHTRRKTLSIAGPLACALMIAAPLAAQRPERPALAISGYVIDAEIDTATHHLAAKATVTFTAPENAEQVTFGFHPALKVTKISDEAGTVLTGERLADGSIRVTPVTPFVRGQAVRWTFEYDGVITGNEDGPVEGLKLAAIQEPITYLLYPARWFPMSGYHDRPVHRRDAHSRAARNAGFRQRRAGRVPSLLSWPAAKTATSMTSTGTSPAFPER